MCDYVNTEKGSVSTDQDNSSLTIPLVWVYNRFRYRISLNNHLPPIFSLKRRLHSGLHSRLPSGSAGIHNTNV